MYEKLTVGLSPLGLCCGVWLRMNFADCCMTNELEFRSCTNCDNIQHKVYKPFEKKRQRLLSTLLTYVIFSQ